VDLKITTDQNVFLCGQLNTDSSGEFNEKLQEEFPLVA